MILHATILTAMAYAWRFAPRGAAVEPDRTAGIVLIKQHEGRHRYFTQDQETSGRQLSDNPHQAREQVLPTEQDNPVDLAAVLPATTDILGAAAACKARCGK